ncbi:AAA family ATPase [Actinocatenispora rupis]|uniref:AAA domain-containing protein n=1 Tax=Actinocatenispora rupis TaxID=519421 RepID=A0A8J3NB19_9ACTN|nr:ATP-binding protein [Actinocatenispora rupis]GID12651.1 hypothetical protein Aru02nite_35400 [Actinocatenispora rupis]
MSGRLVALCGLPGSGKTTLARRLAESGAVRLCPDEWLAELGVDVFDEPFRARLEGRLRSLAGELAVAGVTVVLEFGFWARVERDELRGLGASLGVPVELRFLDAPLAVLRRRLAARVDGVRIGPELLAEYAGWFVAPDAAELALFAPGVRHGVR